MNYIFHKIKCENQFFIHELHISLHNIWNWLFLYILQLSVYIYLYIYLFFLYSLIKNFLHVLLDTTVLLLLRTPLPPLTMHRRHLYLRQLHFPYPNFYTSFVPFFLHFSLTLLPLPFLYRSLSPFPLTPLATSYCSNTPPRLILSSSILNISSQIPLHPFPGFYPLFPLSIPLSYPLSPFYTPKLNG